MGTWESALMFQVCFCTTTHASTDTCVQHTHARTCSTHMCNALQSTGTSAYFIATFLQKKSGPKPNVKSCEFFLPGLCQFFMRRKVQRHFRAICQRWPSLMPHIDKRHQIFTLQWTSMSCQMLSFVNVHALHFLDSLAQTPLLEPGWGYHGSLGLCGISGLVL